MSGEAGFMRLNRIPMCLALCTALLAGQALFAQDATSGANSQNPSTNQTGRRGRRGMHDGQGLQRMAQQLNLTQDQQTKVQDIFKQQRSQAQAIRQNTSLTPEQQKEQLKQLRESTHSQISAVLTPEQQAKMKELRGKGFHKGFGGGMAALNLTPDQHSKIQSIFQQSRSQMQALRQDSSLTSDQKRAKMQEIHQNTTAQINAILTPEQQQQFQQMRQHRGRHGMKPDSAPSQPNASPSGF